MADDRSYAMLGVVSFGLAVGITFALVTVLLGFSAVAFGWGVGVVQVLSSLFVGYAPNFVGVVAGGVWAFFDGFIAGMLVAWFYNRLSARRRRRAP